MLVYILFILLILINIIYVHSEKKYFYIYEWPSELDDVYPPPGAVLDKKASYSHDFYDNNVFNMAIFII